MFSDFDLVGVGVGIGGRVLEKTMKLYFFDTLYRRN
jgi:hypothetical protein